MVFQRHFLTAPPYCFLGQGQLSRGGLCHVWALASSPPFSPLSSFRFHPGREAEMAHQLDRQPCPLVPWGYLLIHAR